MSTVPRYPNLPQSGWYTDVEWAESLQLEPKTFRSNCRQAGIPHTLFGGCMLVRAEDFFAHLQRHASGGDDAA